MTETLLCTKCNIRVTLSIQQDVVIVKTPTEWR